MLHQQITDTGAIHYQEATALAALIRTKQLSSREVVQAHLDRIQAVNPQINAVVTLMAEQALASADAADRAVTTGAPLGALHGVPFSIKDALDTAGVLTQRGSKLFAGNIPDKDATAVARFKAAGGIPLMKSNLPEFSAWTESDNRVTGRTNNPWNLERTPGRFVRRRVGGACGRHVADRHRQRSHDLGARPGRLYGRGGAQGHAWPCSLYRSLPESHITLVSRRANGPHDPRRGPGLLDPEGAGRDRRLRDSCPGRRGRRRRPCRAAGPRGLDLRRGFRAGRSRDQRRGRRGRRPAWPISDARWKKWRCLSLAIPSARWLLLPVARSRLPSKPWPPAGRAICMRSGPASLGCRIPPSLTSRQRTRKLRR